MIKPPKSKESKESRKETQARQSAAAAAAATGILSTPMMHFSAMLPQQLMAAAMIPTPAESLRAWKMMLSRDSALDFVLNDDGDEFLLRICSTIVRSDRTPSAAVRKAFAQVSARWPPDHNDAGEVQLANRASLGEASNVRGAPVVSPPLGVSTTVTSATRIEIPKTSQMQGQITGSETIECCEPTTKASSATGDEPKLGASAAATVEQRPKGYPGKAAGQESAVLSNSKAIFHQDDRDSRKANHPKGTVCMRAGVPAVEEDTVTSALSAVESVPQHQVPTINITAATPSPQAVPTKPDSKVTLLLYPLCDAARDRVRDVGKPVNMRIPGVKRSKREPRLSHFF